MAFEKAHMHRCASSFVTATYEKVGLTPRYSRALPLKLFETPYYNMSLRRMKNTPHSEGLARLVSGAFYKAI